MNRDLLVKIITGNGLQTGTAGFFGNTSGSRQKEGLPLFVGYYDFNSYSGSYTFNSKYSNPSGESIDSNGKVSADTYPLYSLCDSSQINKVSGSGYFDNASILQVGKEFPYRGWSFVFDYQTQDFTGDYGMGRTLFSSMDSSSSTSGFNIGLNGAHKPYFEYVNSGNQLKTFTLSEVELGKNNILSFRRSAESNIVEIIHHDPLYDKNTTGTFVLSDILDSDGKDYSYSDNLYIGDFYTPSAGYTGFTGYVNNLFVWGDFLGEKVTDNIAESFVSSGFSPKRFEAITSTRNIITGATVTTTGVTGQGITGYRSILSGTTSVRCGPDLEIYAQSGLTGDKTGAVFSFVTGTETVEITSYVEKPTTILHDPSLLNKFKRNKIIQRADSSDVFEVYNFTSKQNSLNIEATSYAGAGYFQIKNEHTGKALNFYANGLYKDSGYISGKTLVSGEYHVSGNNKIVFENDLSPSGIDYSNVYDVITGETYISGYTSGLSADQVDVGTTLYSGKDVYLDGQKLISGYNYGQSDGVIYIYRTQLNNGDSDPRPSGSLAFVPRASYAQRIFTSGTQSVDANDGFVAEQVWLNGQRQMRHRDYVFASENSLLNESGIVKYSSNQILFDGSDIGYL